MKLDLSIDQLDLPADLGSALDSEALAEMIEAELARLVESYGTPGGMEGSTLELGTLDLELPAGADAGELGQRIAWQVWRAWTGTPPAPESGQGGASAAGSRPQTATSARPASPRREPRDQAEAGAGEIGLPRTRRTISGSKT